MSHSPTILVVEDDPAVRRGVVDALTYSGYTVLEAATGDEGLELALRATYQLLLLDLVLPGPGGFDILKALRQERPGQAVIILSAKGEEDDRVRGLSLGADDYVMKPFSVRELLARVDAVLRRVSERPAAQVQWAFAGGCADFAKQELQMQGGEVVALSERECGLLKYLAAHGDRVVSRDELFRQVWGVDASRIETRAIDMHIARLRAKLGANAADILLTVRGKGYRVVSAAS